MRFEWDRDQARINFVKHGVSFDEAVTIFYDAQAATFDDHHHSSKEQRLITIGYSAKGFLLVVCHTDRPGSMRIISARRATARERKRHES